MWVMIEKHNIHISC